MQRSVVSIYVWDAPTRLCHWLLVVLVFTSWLTAQEGWMGWHFWSGYATFSLLLFRFVWGFIGSDTARLTRFMRSPLAALRHLAKFRRREADTTLGHNAAGGWMVVLMLTLLAIQVATGLFANDQVSAQGPFSYEIDQGTSDWLTHLHVLTFAAIEIAVLVHITAVFAYRFIPRHDLIRPMITGRKLAATR